MRKFRQLRPAVRKYQQGIATILIVVFAGAALTATTLGTMYRIRGAQEQSVALHAQTQAQIRAWTGAELLRKHLAQEQADGRFETLVETLRTHFQTADAVTGVTPQYVQIALQQSDGTEIPGIEVRLTGVDSVSDLIEASITGITEEGNRSEARTTLNVVYGVVVTDEETEVDVNPPAPCVAQPRAAMVFRGDLNYTGGGLDIVNSRGNMTNVAIDGKLSVSDASMAGLSGCTKDDVALSGGGIAPGTALWSEGNINVRSGMSEPNNVSIWARNFTTVQGGTYSTVQAGAFTAEVINSSNNETVGTTIVGGTLRGSTIHPHSSNTLIITLNNGTRFALPMSKAAVDSDSGAVSPGTSAKRLSGNESLPAQFRLRYTGTDGGTLDMPTGEASIFWGNNIRFGNWRGAQASNLYAYGNVEFRSQGTTIGTLRAGGNLAATPTPTIADGQIGGNYSGSGTPTNLITNVSPPPWSSLPGRPYCDTTTDAIDVDPLRDSANYVFYFDGNTPMLKIQNVVRSNTGERLDGTYNFATTDLRTLGGAAFMQCGWGNNHCMRDGTASRATGWSFLAHRFPAGVLWFEGNVTLNANTGGQPLYGAILSTGNVTLGNAGGDKNVIAPNRATAAQVCGSNFRPDSLCASNSAFATWTDANGTSRTGMPIGNIAIMSEGGLSSEGWTIRGTVSLGGGLSVSSARTTIYGPITVGANVRSPTTVGNGGLTVVMDGVTDDQLFTPGVCTPNDGGGNPDESTPSSVRIMWSRYQ